MAQYKKIYKQTEVSDFERTVADALYDIQNSASTIAPVVKKVYFTAAREIEVTGGSKACVMFVPISFLATFQSIQNELSQEFEKKLAGYSLVIIAERRMMKKPSAGSNAARPYSRTLTAVHDAILDDVCYPANIVGKRTHYRATGPTSYSVILDANKASVMESKTNVISSVYKKLTGKDVVVAFGAF